MDEHAEHHGHHAGMMMPGHDDGSDSSSMAYCTLPARPGLMRINPKSARRKDRAWTVTEIDRSWPTRWMPVAVIQIPCKFWTEPALRISLMAKLTRWGVDFHMDLIRAG